MCRLWDRHLGRWDHVVKAAANIRCGRPDVVVIRNWNTLELGDPRPPTSRTALYSGNLGWGTTCRASWSCAGAWWTTATG